MDVFTTKMEFVTMEASIKVIITAAITVVNIPWKEYSITVTYLIYIRFVA